MSKQAGAKNVKESFKKIYQTVALLALSTSLSFATTPLEAKDVAKVADKTAVNTPNPVKKDSNVFTTAPVGAKSTDELLKQYISAFAHDDEAIYLSLLKGHLRTRMRMQMQFRRDCKKSTGNFRYLTLAEERARLGPAGANVGKNAVVDGEKVTYELPVVGFIDYDLRTAPDAKPEVIATAVGKDKNAYYLVIRSDHFGKPVIKTKAAEPAVPAPANPAAVTTTPGKANPGAGHPAVAPAKVKP